MMLKLLLLNSGLMGNEGGWEGHCRVWVIWKISGVPVPAAERSPGYVLRGVEFLRSTRPSCWDHHFSHHSNLFFGLCDIIGGVFGHYSLHHHPNPTIEHCEMVCIYVRTKVQPEVFHVLQGDDLLDMWESHNIAIFFSASWWSFRTLFTPPPPQFHSRTLWNGVYMPEGVVRCSSMGSRGSRV